MALIEPLRPDEFPLCGSIWNMGRSRDLAERFYAELLTQNRITFIYKDGGAFVGEVSLVYDMHDRDYTIPGQRINLSRLIVKDTHRRRGIGTALSQHIFQYARECGYTEMALGVDLDNYAAIKLYSGLGFTHIIRADQDSQGAYLKLLKYL